MWFCQTSIISGNLNFKENILYFFVTDIIIMLLKFPLFILSKCKNEKCCCCSNRFFIFNWLCCQNDLYGFLLALKHVFFKALLLYDQNSHKSLTTYVLLLAGTTIFFGSSSWLCWLLAERIPETHFFLQIILPNIRHNWRFFNVLWTEGTQEL